MLTITIFTFFIATVKQKSLFPKKRSLVGWRIQKFYFFLSDDGSEENHTLSTFFLPFPFFTFLFFFELMIIHLSFHVRNRYHTIVRILLFLFRTKHHVYDVAMISSVIPSHFFSFLFFFKGFQFFIPRDHTLRRMVTNIFDPEGAL